MITLKHPLVLASNSPRRQQLLRELGFDFTVEVRPTPELFPPSMPALEVAPFLAAQKAEQFRPDLADKIVLCADTIVVIDNQILNKPANVDEARQMLQQLSGRTHQVMTGVCMLTAQSAQTLCDIAQVRFRQLSDFEIDYYIKKCAPFDKAGAYGVQEWIGMVGIESIEGSFYTIMGLPLHRVYALLQPYFEP
jgi:septum formation protein